MTQTSVPTEITSNGIPAYRGSGYFAERVRESASRADIISVIQGLIGALHIPHFFSDDECQIIIDGLMDCELGSYDETYVTPRIAKLGPGAYDFYKDGQFVDDYWERARRATALRCTLLSDSDPLDIALGRLREIWGGPVEIARVKGRTMFAGLIREINYGTRMHTDEIVRQFPGVLDEAPIAQLAFNCYLTVPAEGGDLVIYHQRWQPHHENLRDGYGYHENLVLDTPSLTVHPTLGGAVLFDPRHYHAVTPSSTDKHRVALSFFIGLTSHGSLLVWS